MSAELDELYQSIILDHNRRPKNFREMEDATAKADGVNPLCGDQLTVWIKLEGDQLTDVSFRGQGCAISKASASMMTQVIKGKSRADAEKMFDDVHALVTGHPTGADVGSLRLSNRHRRRAPISWHAKRAMHISHGVESATHRPAP